MAEIKSVEQQNFEIDVLTRLASIDTKLEDLKSYKSKVDVAIELANTNKQTNTLQEERIKDLENRVKEIENKPSRNWNDLIKIISSIVITAIITLVLAKIGLN